MDMSFTVEQLELCISIGSEITISQYGKKCAGARSLHNPGNILEFHSLAHRIKPILRDGIELDYIHRLSVNKSILGNCVLSHNKPSGFRFGGIYTAQVHGNIMQTPTIRADINPSTLATNIGILYYPFRCLKLEVELQKASDNAALQMQTCMELSTNNSTLTSNLYDVGRDRGRATLSFLRAISGHVSLGSELFLEWGKSKTVMADTAIAGRYKRHSYAISGTASRHGIDISYWQRIHERLEMASMWAWHRKSEKSVGTICYQWDFDNADIKGSFDSNLSLGLMYSRYLQQIPLLVAYSLFVSLPTNRFVFGLKLILDPRGMRRGE